MQTTSPETWLPQRLVKVATSLGELCREPVEFSIEPRATEEAVQQIEMEIGRNIPRQLYQFFLNVSAQFEFDWYFDRDFVQRLPDRLQNVRGGYVDFSLSSLDAFWTNWSADWEQRFTVEQRSPNSKIKYEFHNLFPIHQDGGGNSLVLVIDGPNEGAVLIQGFEDLGMANARLASSFDSFLDIWSKLGFAGPDPLALRPFYDEKADSLLLDLPTSKEWRSLCGIESV